jgi:DNA-binding Lrp family transcriptional regulator
MDMSVKHRPAATEPPWITDDRDEALITAIQTGLPLCPQPFAELGQAIGLSESEVLARLQRLQDEGIIKRLGVVVRHRELGYHANAMTVWDIPDERVRELGACLGQFDFVTLCYRRPRRLPDWPYNLFTMIHGRDRAEVEAHVVWLIERCGLQGIAHELLFSQRRFKQRGAIYHADRGRAAGD